MVSGQVAPPWTDYFDMRREIENWNKNPYVATFLIWRKHMTQAIMIPFWTGFGKNLRRRVIPLVVSAIKDKRRKHQSEWQNLWISFNPFTGIPQCDDLSPLLISFFSRVPLRYTRQKRNLLMIRSTWLAPLHQSRVLTLEEFCWKWRNGITIPKLNRCSSIFRI